MDQEEYRPEPPPFRLAAGADSVPDAENYKFFNHETGQEFQPGDQIPHEGFVSDIFPKQDIYYRGITRLPGSHTPGHIAVDAYVNGQYKETRNEATPLEYNGTIAHRDDPNPRILQRGPGFNDFYRDPEDTDPFSGLEYMYRLSPERTRTTGDLELLHPDTLDRFGQWFDALPPEQRRQYHEHPTIESAWNDWRSEIGQGHPSWQGSGVGGRGDGGYGQDDTLMNYYIHKQTKDWDPDKDAFDPREFGV